MVMSSTQVLAAACPKYNRKVILLLVVLMMIRMEGVQGFFFSSLASMSHHGIAKSPPVKARLPSGCRAVKMMEGEGWDDDEDVRFMSPKHIDTGFLKVSSS